MTTIRCARVGDIAEQVRGVSYSKFDASTSPAIGLVPILRANNITDSGLTLDDLVYVPKERVSAKQMLRCGDVVIAASSGSLDVVGKAAQCTGAFEGSFGAFCKVMRPSSDVDARYFGHFFKTADYRRKVSSLAAGANINNLRNEHLDELVIPLPPLAEQRRIAAILDKTEALRAKRREAINRHDELRRALFIEVFGDPAINPKRWRLQKLSALAVKFSDGPFGSNLKTSHYTETGVRVIRLQNIGVGELLDEDEAFISEEHFRSLLRHECNPGDVLVGTLGDPNLRACIQPASLPKALNKADCVQIRPDLSVATPEYLCALLNTPATERMAHSLILGQTRARISMGRLRELEIPVPPVELQRSFSQQSSRLSSNKARLLQSNNIAEDLFASLQHRAFRGEL